MRRRLKSIRMIHARNHIVGILPGNRRLTLLVALLVAISLLAFYKRSSQLEPETRISANLTRVSAPPSKLSRRSAPVVIQLPARFRSMNANPVPSLLLEMEPVFVTLIHRNLFRYTDTLPAPPVVPLPPPLPPPPPPPEIRPEAHFIGTVFRGELVALFGLKSEILTLREGDLLEQKYIVKHIDPETVLLEDRNFHNTASFSVTHK